jgi:hypothetical protein
MEKLKQAEEPSNDKLATLEHPPAGWFAVDVMRRNDTRKWDWVALMVSVRPDDLKTHACDFPARFVVHPKDYRPDGRKTAQQCWVLVPGKHRNWEAAWEALHAMDGHTALTEDI